MTQYILKKVSDLTSENSDFRLIGFGGIALPNQESTIEWQLPQERWISGGTFFVCNAKCGDRASMYTVKKTEGQEDVEDIFVEDLVIPELAYFEYKLDVPYINLVDQGFYIRIVYSNNDATNTAKVGMNLTTHIPMDSI
jgi:hypothetical protein